MRRSCYRAHRRLRLTEREKDCECEGSHDPFDGEGAQRAFDRLDSSRMPHAMVA